MLPGSRESFSARSARPRSESGRSSLHPEPAASPCGLVDAHAAVRTRRPARSGKFPSTQSRALDRQVCVDAGHPTRSNPDEEPVAAGSEWLASGVRGQRRRAHRDAGRRGRHGRLSRGSRRGGVLAVVLRDGVRAEAAEGEDESRNADVRRVALRAALRSSGDQPVHVGWGRVHQCLLVRWRAAATRRSRTRSTRGPGRPGRPGLPRRRSGATRRPPPGRRPGRGPRSP